MFGDRCTQMLGGINTEKAYIVCGYTDMRRSIDGLAAIIKQNYDCNPYNRCLYLFCGKRSDRIKGLLWDDDGFMLLYKRLDNGRFRWPRNKSEVTALTSEQLVWLMQGLEIEQPNAIKKYIPKDMI